MPQDSVALADEIQIDLQSVVAKRLKIMVAVNTLTSIDSAVYSNHCQFWYRLGRSCQDVDFMLYHPSRISIDRMRNLAAKAAIDSQCDYLLFIDDDVLIPVNTLQELVNCKSDVAAGWTIIRGYPFENMFFKWIEVEGGVPSLKLVRDPVTFRASDGLIECDAVGFSCVLIKVDLLKKVPSPWFVTGPFNTEDVYFCVKARQQDPNCTIVVNPRVLTAHNLGTEFINPTNKALYKNYVEECNPEMFTPEIVNAPAQPLEKQTDIEGGMSYETALKDSLKL